MCSAQVQHLNIYSQHTLPTLIVFFIFHLLFIFHLGTPTSAVLRSGKEISPPSIAKLEHKLHRTSKTVTKLSKENTMLKSLVGVRYRDLADKFETEKNLAIKENNQVHQEELKSLRKELTKTQIELKKQQRETSAQTEQKEAWKQQALVYMDVANDERQEAQKAIKAKVKTSTQKYNLQRKVKRRETKISKMLEDFERDKNITQQLHKQIVDELKRRNLDVTKNLASLQKLDTKRGGHYVAEVRLVYYDLLTKGVSCNIIEDVVRTVLEGLGSKDLKNTPLPKRSTAQRMKAEVGYLVKLRLAREWKLSAEKSAVFQSDKTTKGQLEWLSLVVKLRRGPGSESQTFTLSIEPIASGTSEATLDRMKRCLDDLCDIAVRHGIVDTIDEAKTIYSVANIVGKMSDRAATETKLTRLLIEEKAKLLADSNLTDQELEERSKVYAFTCSLHKINNTAVALTTAAEKHLEYSENDIKGTRHIYQTDKLICVHSKKEYAKGQNFRGYCLSTDQLDVSGSKLFKPIVGGRYLVYLENAVPTYCSKDLIMLFLVDLKESKKLNKLEQGVYEGFLDVRVQAELRALAIMYHDLIKPLYIAAEAATCPLSMNSKYEKAVRKMEQFAVNSDTLFDGTDPDLVADHSASCKIDAYMAKVRESHPPTDDTVKRLLGVMCAAGADKLRKHASEHLPGGEYWKSRSLNVRRAAKIVGDSTNNAVEGRFATVGLQLDRCSISNPLHVGGNAAGKHDKVVNYIRQQPKDQQVQLCQAAMEGAAHERFQMGTREAQVKRLWEEGKDERQIKKAKYQKSQQRAKDKESELDQAIQSDEFITSLERLERTRVTAAMAKQQIRLWITLAKRVALKDSKLFKGFSTKNKDQLVALLQQLITDNADVLQHYTADQEVSDVESVCSSSDEEDLLMS